MASRNTPPSGLNLTIGTVRTRPITDPGKIRLGRKADFEMLRSDRRRVQRNRALQRVRLAVNAHVRIAGFADAAAIEQVLLASYPALMTGVYDHTLLVHVLPMMTRANPKLLASGTYYLAEADGEPVGCGGWTPEEPGTGNVLPALAHIRHFGVAAGWTGRGVGRALFAHCEAEARRAGMRRFECYASLNGEAFYAALGFVAIGPINVAMAPEIALPSVLMRRMI